MVGIFGGGSALAHYPVPDLEAAPPPSGPNSLVCSHSLANHSNEWDTLVLET